jgi:ribosomal protein L29
MKKNDYLAELRDLATADVKQRISELSEELMKLRFRNAIGQLDQTHQFSEIKVKVAQAKTVLKEKMQEAQAAA